MESIYAKSCDTYAFLWWSLSYIFLPLLGSSPSPSVCNFVAGHSFRFVFLASAFLLVCLLCHFGSPKLNYKINSLKMFSFSHTYHIRLETLIRLYYVYTMEYHFSTSSIFPVASLLHAFYCNNLIDSCIVHTCLKAYSSTYRNNRANSLTINFH